MVSDTTLGTVIAQKTPEIGVTDPAVLADRRRSMRRARDRRFRQRRIREMFGTAARVCDGQDSCIWRSPGRRCSCRRGDRCACELVMLRGIVEEAEARIGTVPSGILAAALLDLSRETLLGKADGIRGARLKLLEILLGDQRRREDLALRERRAAAEDARRPRSLADVMAGMLDGTRQDSPGATRAGSLESKVAPAAVVAPGRSSREIEQTHTSNT